MTLSKINLYNSLKAKSIIFDYKSKGKKVVFTNGCFDIIHKGHKIYLKAARELGDFLIIGLNSDSSVKALKGPGRPVNDENFRAKNLLKLDYVDAVTIFCEKTPNNLVHVLSPDLIVKGGDYKQEEVIGGDHVRSYGGKVVILPYVPGYSTTNIIKQRQGKDLTAGEASD
jgi:D-beta-D-heptose 7-phosphate kinase/D-beta-D-heptose 1-phosphate adenosyltransferase